MITSKLVEFFNSCEYINDINVNYLNDDGEFFSIEISPTYPIIKQYVDGTCKKGIDFILAIRKLLNRDVAENIENSEFCEKIIDWINEKNKKGELPDMGDNAECLSIVINTNWYAFSVTEDTVRYQIQLQLTYKERK